MLRVSFLKKITKKVYKKKIIQKYNALIMTTTTTIFA